MNILIDENNNIISYGDIDYKIKNGEKIIKDYNNSWPIKDDIPLRKDMCYWDHIGGSVKVKTQDMINADFLKSENRNMKIIATFLLPLIENCNSFDEFKNKILQYKE